MQHKNRYSISHNYCTNYLPQDLNIRKMYKFYCQWCAENDKQPVRNAITDIFFVP